MGYWKSLSGKSQRQIKRESSGGTTITVEYMGLDELTECLKQLPVKWAKKPMLSTLRKGANEYNKALRENTPVTMSDLRKTIKTRVAKGNRIALTAGMFANSGISVVTKSGKVWDPFYILYWANYGTLANRDSSHKFDRARKPASSKWAGGITPKRFAEKSWEQSKEKAEKAINENFDKETLKFFKKYQVTE